MSTIEEKLSQRTATTNVANGYMHIILPNGSIYESFKISTADRIKAENAERAYKKVFSNSDLVAGVLTVTHNKGTEDIGFTLKDPSGNIVTSSVVPVVVDDNNITIDFGGEIEVGNWVLNVISWKQ